MVSFVRSGLFYSFYCCLTMLGWSLPDAQPNPAFPVTDGTVTAMTRIGNTIYLGGEFAHVGGVARQGLAAVNAFTGQVLNWNPELPPSGKTPRVRAMAASSTTVFVTGEFALIGGVKRVVLAAIDGVSGQVTPFDAHYATDLVRPAAQGPIYALAWSSMGLLVGGDFGAIGSASRNGFAVLDPATGNATSWNKIQGNEVRAVRQRGNLTYVAGSLVVYNNYNQVVRHNLAAIDMSTGVVAAFNPEPTGTLDPNSGVPAGRIEQLDVFDSKAMVYGNFTSIGGQSRTGVAVLDLATGQALNWAPPGGGSWYGFTEFGNTLLACVVFHDGTRPPRWEVWALDPANGQELTWSPAVDGEPMGFGTYGNAVLMCGAFTTVAGTPRRGFAWFGPKAANPVSQWRYFE